MAKRCKHEHLIVSPVEERGLGKTGLNDYRELLYFKVYCLKCKKNVMKYDRHDTMEVLKAHFLRTKGK